MRFPAIKITLCEKICHCLGIKGISMKEISNIHQETNRKLVYLPPSPLFQEAQQKSVKPKSTCDTPASWLVWNFCQSNVGGIN